MSELTEEWIAETLLLAMDGDFLPGAGMSIGNEDEDVPLRHARPKEVAWWAADAIVSALAVRRPAPDPTPRRGGEDEEKR